MIEATMEDYERMKSDALKQSVFIVQQAERIKELEEQIQENAKSNIDLAHTVNEMCDENQRLRSEKKDLERRLQAAIKMINKSYVVLE